MSAAHSRRRERDVTHRVGAILRLYSVAIEQEPHRGGRLALTFAKGVHQLLQRRGPLDLEENLVVVVRHLDVQVLGRLGILGLVGWRGRCR